MATIVAVGGYTWDITGGSWFTISSGNRVLIVGIAFLVFAVITLVKEIDSALQSYPNLQYDGLSPAKNSVNVSTGLMGNIISQDIAYFYRIAFKNNARSPSGVNSTAPATTAEISIFDKIKKLDSWIGRWPANYQSSTYAEKVRADRLDILPGNQQAILDIGMRYEEKSDFVGWDNQYVSGQLRKAIPFGRYALKVVLAPSNYTKKEWWFMLTIPNANQIDDLNQVQIKQVRKRDLFKEGILTERALVTYP